MAYRSTPHAVTGVSPAEMMYKRKMRTKLPENVTEKDKCVDRQVRERDAYSIQKGKLYADNKRNATKHDVVVGDSVLIEKQKENKLSPRFSQEPHTVIHTNGSAITAQDNHGTIVKRNVSQTKKYVKREVDDCNITESVDGQNNEDNETIETDAFPSRPKRNIMKPKYLEDYVCD